LRIYAEPDDLTLSEMERAAIEKGITKKQLVLDAVDQRWKENNQIKSELNQAKRDLEAGRSREDLLRSEVDKSRSEKDQASSEAVGLHRDLEHFKETLRLKDDEINFLRGHLSQLSEKITPQLPPSQEEARTKGWWQFWK
jgi:uncharacterized protein (DUF3084 family)